MLKHFSELRMSIDHVILDVIDEWGDDLLPNSGGNPPDKNEARAITIVVYSNDDGYHNYILYENGELYRITFESIDDGHTWNGDDVYTKAYKKVFTVHEKVGQIEILDLDYSDDENIENVVCQMIEALREIE